MHLHPVLPTPTRVSQTTTRIGLRQPCLRCTKTKKQGMRWQERSGERDEAEYVGYDAYAAPVYGAVRGRETMTRRCRWNGTERKETKPRAEASTVWGRVPLSLSSLCTWRRLPSYTTCLARNQLLGPIIFLL
jgi:hypothetical protein